MLALITALMQYERKKLVQHHSCSDFLTFEVRQPLKSMALFLLRILYQNKSRGALKHDLETCSFAKCDIFHLRFN